jgi:hypothetical protein
VIAGTRTAHGAAASSRAGAALTPRVVGTVAAPKAASITAIINARIARA